MAINTLSLSILYTQFIRKVTTEKSVASLSVHLNFSAETNGNSLNSVWKLYMKRSCVNFS